MAFTDQQVMQEIQYTVIEPPDLGQTWGSGLWSKDEIVRYLNQRQNKFLKDTHLQVGISNITAAQSDYEYDLPDDWINTVRVNWIAGGAVTELTRSDSWEADHGIPTWPYTEGKPKLYMDSGGDTLAIRIAPVPNAAGTLQLYYVPLAAELDATGELLTLPDAFVPSVKYGALSDMFGKVGRAHDPERAQYCESRYQLGVEVTRMLLMGWQ